jgi:hypothetical protein
MCQPIRLDTARRRLRALEAARSDRIAQRQHAQADARAAQALRDGPPLAWLQPQRGPDGHVRHVLTHWQPSMGDKARLLALIDHAEDAAHGRVPFGIPPAQRLTELTRTIRRILRDAADKEQHDEPGR